MAEGRWYQAAGFDVGLGFHGVVSVWVGDESPGGGVRRYDLRLLMNRTIAGQFFLRVVRAVFIGIGTSRGALAHAGRVVFFWNC